MPKGQRGYHGTPSRNAKRTRRTYRKGQSQAVDAQTKALDKKAGKDRK